MATETSEKPYYVMGLRIIYLFPATEGMRRHLFAL
jgi:hypothetical protein